MEGPYLRYGTERLRDKKAPKKGDKKGDKKSDEKRRAERGGHAFL